LRGSKPDGKTAQAVEFGLLGLLEVTDGGRVVPIPSARQRALLACLLLHAGELVTVDELVEAIWGDGAGHDGFTDPGQRPSPAQLTSTITGFFAATLGAGSQP
jgi:hypothetical protein